MTIHFRYSFFIAIVPVSEIENFLIIKISKERNHNTHDFVNHKSCEMCLPKPIINHIRNDSFQVTIKECRTFVKDDISDRFLNLNMTLEGIE